MNNSNAISETGMQENSVNESVSHDSPTYIGRFAPSPTGRMHLGNVFSALVSWLYARQRKGKWILRIEDLDPQRSKLDYAYLIEEDLIWLGLDFDLGGVDTEYCQSHRSKYYEDALNKLRESGLTYRCRCSRSDIMDTQAPHQTDGRVVYSGKCRPKSEPPFEEKGEGSVRLFVPDKIIEFTDSVYGKIGVNLSTHCGDFVLRRADGAWAYQLAVVVDDSMMGVSHVVRGNDLLLSAAQQLYLYDCLGLSVPSYTHLPLLCNSAGKRFSKRDSEMNMEYLRKKMSAAEIIGLLAYKVGMIDKCQPCMPKDLIDKFSENSIPRKERIIIDSFNG